jgi:hypothetical protein
MHARMAENARPPSLGGPVAGWSSLAARRAHNPKVAGSNPAPATNSPDHCSHRDRPTRFALAGLVQRRSHALRLLRPLEAWRQPWLQPSRPVVRRAALGVTHRSTSDKRGMKVALASHHSPVTRRPQVSRQTRLLAWLRRRSTVRGTSHAASILAACRSHICIRLASGACPGATGGGGRRSWTHRGFGDWTGGTDGHCAPHA